jgi:hypothetical protein
MTNIPEGYGFVAGRSRENAKAILAAAEKAGVDPSLVSTVIGGYLAPEAAVIAYENRNNPTEEKAPSEEPAEEEPDAGSDEDGYYGPDRSWSNADIEAYARDNNIDLGGATKKADMLSAISAATKEE